MPLKTKTVVVDFQWEDCCKSIGNFKEFGLVAWRRGALAHGMARSSHLRRVMTLETICMADIVERR